MCLRTSHGKRESTEKNLRKLKKNLNPAFSLTHNPPSLSGGVVRPNRGQWGGGHYLEVRFGPSKSTCYFATAGTPSTIKRYAKSSKSNTSHPKWPLQGGPFPPTGHPRGGIPRGGERSVVNGCERQCGYSQRIHNLNWHLGMPQDAPKVGMKNWKNVKMGSFKRHAK